MLPFSWFDCCVTPLHEVRGDGFAPKVGTLTLSGVWKFLNCLKRSTKRCCFLVTSRFLSQLHNMGERRELQNYTVSVWRLIRWIKPVNTYHYVKTHGFDKPNGTYIRSYQLERWSTDFILLCFSFCLQCYLFRSLIWEDEWFEGRGGQIRVSSTA